MSTFKTALDFYVRAYMKADSQEEQEKLRPYLAMAANPRKPISNLEGYEPLHEDVIKQQKENVAEVLDSMCADMSTEKPIEVVSKLKELDFCVRQEIVNAGWTLTEKKGKVVVYIYLP